VENYEAEQLEPPSPTEFVATSPQRNIRPTKKNLIYSAVSIVYLVTVVLLIVTKSDNSSLNSEVKELNGQIDSLESDNGDKDNTISSLEVDLSNVQYDLDSANSTIDVLQQPQSTYFDYDGSWSVELDGPGSCTGWTSNTDICSQYPVEMSIYSGSVSFGNSIIPSTNYGYSVSGGYFTDGTNSNSFTCDDLYTTATIEVSLTATALSPSVDGIIATAVSGTARVNVTPQRGCRTSSISFSFTATR
jgi:cell division protein FtsL